MLSFRKKRKEESAAEEKEAAKEFDASVAEAPSVDLPSEAAGAEENGDLNGAVDLISEKEGEEEESLTADARADGDGVLAFAAEEPSAPEAAVRPEKAESEGTSFESRQLELDARKKEKDGEKKKQEVLSRIHNERLTEREMAEYTAKQAVERIEEFSRARYSGTDNERLAAQKIRDIVEESTGRTARLEPFNVWPFAGRLGIPVYGMAYLAVLLLYIIYQPLGIVLIPVLAAVMLVQIRYNGNVFSRLFPRKTSYNVVSEYRRGDKTVNTVILGCRYDTDYDKPVDHFLGRHKTNPKVKETGIWLILISMALTFVFAVILSAVKNPPKALKIVLLLINVIVSGLAIAYMATYFNYFKDAARESREGLSGLGIGLAIMKYYTLHPWELPDGTKLVFAAFGSSFAGNKGSEAFIKAHRKDDLLVKPLIIDLDNMLDGEYAVTVADTGFKTDYNAKLCSAVAEGIKAGGGQVIKESRHFYYNDALPFARKGYAAVCVSRKSGHKKQEYKDCADTYSQMLAAVRESINGLKQ